MGEFFTGVDTTFSPDFFEAAKAVLADRKVKGLVIGTEGESLPAGYKMKLDQLLEGNRIVDASPLLGLCRMVKTEVDVRRLRRATEMTVKSPASCRARMKVCST